MKKFLSCTKTATLLLIVTLLVLGFYVYFLARPISYGMNYHSEYVYEGVTFEGNMIFSTGNTVTVNNSNYDEDMEFFYYYKDGYVFTLIAETEEEYEEEVDYIEENFEEAVNSPFYATKTNAFKQVVEGPDGYTTFYTCQFAIVLAVVLGVVELMLIGLTVLSWILWKKSGRKESAI